MPRYIRPHPKMEQAIELLVEHYYLPLELKYPGRQLVPGEAAEAGRLWRALDGIMYSAGIPFAVWASAEARDEALDRAQKRARGRA